MIIGLSGRKGSGKSIVSFELIKKGFKKVSFADPLKQMAASLYGVKIDDMYDQAKKEEILKTPLKWNQETFLKMCKIFGCDWKYSESQTREFNSLREMLQFIGTDVIRSYDVDFHMNKMIGSLDSNKNYVCDDFRFQNEKNALEKHGAICVFILRPGITEISNHQSEIDLKWNNFKYHIVNDQSVEHLISSFDSIMREINKEINTKQAFLFATEKSAFFAGFLLANSSFEKDWITVKSSNAKIMEELHQYVDFTAPFWINCAPVGEKHCLLIKNPFIIENLKHWNFHAKWEMQIPDIIKNSPKLIKAWEDGIKAE